MNKLKHFIIFFIGAIVGVCIGLYLAKIINHIK